MVRAVFWDRDGVLNAPVLRADGKFTAPWKRDEFQVLPGAISALHLTAENGFLNFVVTNQPDLHDTLALDTLMHFHTLLQGLAPITDIKYASQRGSPFYKPNPGMILEIVKRYYVNVSESFMVGDSWRDMEAGDRAGLTTIFIDSGREDAALVKFAIRAESAFYAANKLLRRAGVPA